VLIYSMSGSVDGFIADREGAFGWTAPSDELFRFHLAEVGELGGFLCGRRLYETMLVWETDPSLREDEPGAAFADVWSAIPKVVFSRTLDGVQGNARLAEASLAEEVAAALDATDKDVSIGGAGLAAQASSSASSTSCACSATRSSSVAARRSCRPSPSTSRWTWPRPGRSARA
jgi:dihydrofolate reductase